MARKKNIIERTPRLTAKLYPRVRDTASFLEMVKTIRRWPQASRVHDAHDQSVRAKDGKLTQRERASRRAWSVLCKVFGRRRMLTGKLDKDFRGACADVLDAARVPAPAGSDPELGWDYGTRVRDLIERHRKRLQPLTR